MHRRQFLAASLAASAFPLAQDAAAQSAMPASREFYQIRRYHLQSGPQTKLTESYFADALIPALSRMGMGPIGAFRLDYGPETPAFYLLIPAPTVDALATVEFKLAQDSDFLKAAEPFWDAPATAPAFIRVESQLLAAFEGWPRVTPPAKEKRIFQMRTYESPSDQDHIRKVEMFHKGEFDSFKNAGFHPVFFGDTLIGPRLPNLTYMLSLGSVEELDAKWAAFSGDPGWKKLSSSPRYNYESIVSNITNLILTPLSASQI